MHRWSWPAIGNSKNRSWLFWDVLFFTCSGYGSTIGKRKLITLPLRQHLAMFGQRNIWQSRTHSWQRGWSSEFEGRALQAPQKLNGLLLSTLWVTAVRRTTQLGEGRHPEWGEGSSTQSRIAATAAAAAAAAVVATIARTTRATSARLWQKQQK